MLAAFPYFQGSSSRGSLGGERWRLVLGTPYWRIQSAGIGCRIRYPPNSKYTGFATHTTCTQCSPRYYIIDFGYSRRYNPNELPSDVILAAGDRSAPEIQGQPSTHSTRLNPFPFDVYCLGNILCRDYKIHLSSPMHFLLPLVNDMTWEEPSLRHTMGKALARCVKLCNSLSTSQLRASPSDTTGFGQRCRRLKYTVTGVAPPPVKKFSEPVTATDSRFWSFSTLTLRHAGGMTTMEPCL
ncbi:hypothetical protein EDD85DRAFT_260532 [Armillaria nabsnona]|nr:hypothetical protein EDD85DRAFT_260532 [Armillaria nabsnona]